MYWEFSICRNLCFLFLNVSLGIFVWREGYNFFFCFCFFFLLIFCLLILIYYNKCHVGNCFGNFLVAGKFMFVVSNQILNDSWAFLIIINSFKTLPNHLYCLCLKNLLSTQKLKCMMLINKKCKLRLYIHLI